MTAMQNRSCEGFAQVSHFYRIGTGGNSLHISLDANGRKECHGLLDSLSVQGLSFLRPLLLQFEVLNIVGWGEYIEEF